MYDGPFERVTIENARLTFRNFSGKRGKREFGVFLPRETALQMMADGWNVLRFAGEDFYIPIKIGKTNENRLPKIELSNSSGRVILQNDDDLDNLDKIDIDKVDVTIFPYHWMVGEKYGVSACVKSLHITAKEDNSEV